MGSSCSQPIALTPSAPRLKAETRSPQPSTRTLGCPVLCPEARCPGGLWEAGQHIFLSKDAWGRPAAPLALGRKPGSGQDSPHGDSAAFSSQGAPGGTEASGRGRARPPQPERHAPAPTLSPVPAPLQGPCPLLRSRRPPPLRAPTRSRWRGILGFEGPPQPVRSHPVGGHPPALNRKPVSAAEPPPAAAHTGQRRPLCRLRSRLQS